MNQRTLRRNDYGLGSLGVVEEIPDWWSGGTTTTPDPVKAVTPKKDTWSVIDNILNIGQKTANVVTTVIPAKTKTVTIPGSSSPQVIPDTPPAPEVKKTMSTTTKVLIGTGAAALVGTIGYFAFGRKKKGLGCPETPALGGVKKKRKSKKRRK